MKAATIAAIFVGAALFLGGCSTTPTFTWGGRGDVPEGTYRVPLSTVRSISLDPFPPASSSADNNVKTWEDTRRTPELYFNLHRGYRLRPEIEEPVLRRI